MHIRTVYSPMHSAKVFDRRFMSPILKELNITLHIVLYDEIYFKNLVGIISITQIMMYVG